MHISINSAFYIFQFLERKKIVSMTLWEYFTDVVTPLCGMKIHSLTCVFFFVSFTGDQPSVQEFHVDFQKYNLQRHTQRKDKHNRPLLMIKLHYVHLTVCVRACVCARISEWKTKDMIVLKVQLNKFLVLLCVHPEML